METKFMKRVNNKSKRLKFLPFQLPQSKESLVAIITPDISLPHYTMNTERKSSISSHEFQNTKNSVMKSDDLWNAVLFCFFWLVN